MKKLTYLVLSLVLISLAIGYWGCNQEQKQLTEPALNYGPTGPPGGGQSGTTLSATVTHECFNYFTWTLSKEMGVGPYVLCPGDAAQEVPIVVDVTKGTQVSGVTGQVCVTNGGGVSTEGLRIVATLMYKIGDDPAGQYIPGNSVVVDVSAMPIIAGDGASYCYSYTINAPISPNNMYKVNADVTITNHSGSLPPKPPKGPSPDSDSEHGCTPCDDTVTLTDESTQLTGWSITIAPESYQVSASGQYPFTMTLSNLSTYGNSVYEDVNTAKLTTQCQGIITSSVVYFKSDVGCTPPNGACTRTIGYWKTHAGFNGRNPDVVTQHLPIWLGTEGGAKSLQVTSASQAVTVLNRLGVSSNGINKLYSQLLAAKFNILAGTNPVCIAEVIALADAFLAMKNSADWEALPKPDRTQVNQWMSMLDQYNNGLLECADHCE